MKRLLPFLCLLLNFCCSASPPPSDLTQVSPDEAQLLQRLAALPPEQAETTLSAHLAPDSSPLLLYTAAQLAFQLKRHALAEARLRQLLSAHPHFPHARRLLAQTLIAQDQHAPAADILRELLNGTPDEPRHLLWALLAQTLNEGDHPTAALTAIDNAIALAPQPREDYLRLRLHLLLKLQQADAAVRLARVFLRQHPQDESLWRLLIQQQLDAQQLQRAAALAELAIRAGNRSPQLLQLRHQLLNP